MSASCTGMPSGELVDGYCVQMGAGRGRGGLTFSVAPCEEFSRLWSCIGKKKEDPIWTECEAWFLWVLLVWPGTQQDLYIGVANQSLLSGPYDVRVGWLWTAQCRCSPPVCWKLGRTDPGLGPYTVFLAVSTRTMLPTPPAARAWTHTHARTQAVSQSQQCFLSHLLCQLKHYFRLSVNKIRLVTTEHLSLQSWKVAAVTPSREMLVLAPLSRNAQFCDSALCDVTKGIASPF